MKKILTIILDGFGMRDEVEGNAIKGANMEFFNSLWDNYPHSLLKASEEAVGLKEGEFGNSEIGHQTIGAGRMIKTNGTLVDELLASNLSENEVFNKLISNKDKDIHLMGLCSDGGVHSNINQILKVYDILVNNGFKKIHFHLITDGRDTDRMSSMKYINQVIDKIKSTKVGDIATICGRYYAMDRDKHYDRTKKYYELVTKGIGINTNNIESTIKALYEKGVTDEYLTPIVVSNNLIKNGDILLWLNYREDRARQIISSFADTNFDGFNSYNIKVDVYSFLPVSETITINNLTTIPEISNPLGVYLSNLGLTQARIAETEKYAHVTYFFDGLSNTKLAKCSQFLIPSPDVATFDLKPEMSAVGVTKKIVECMMQDYDFILANYANADMVGHTGNFDATVKACMAIDLCLKKVIEQAEENFYKVIILADHGNADNMINNDGTVITSHSTAKVPFIILDNNVELEKEGDITMVAPTILEYMDIAVPEEMKETPILLK